jgi:hypothetical protein
MVRRLFVLLLACAPLAPAARAADTPRLAWKFNLTRPFYQEATVQIDANINIMGQDVKIKGKETWYFAWTPVKQVKENWVLTQTILAGVIEVDLQGTKVTLDTRKKIDPASASPEDKFLNVLKQVIGHKFAVTLGPDRRIIKLEGYEELVQKVKAGFPDEAKGFLQFIKKSTFMQYSSVFFAGLPGKAYDRGVTWKSPGEFQVGVTGRVKGDNVYTAGEGGKVKVKSAMEFEAGKDENTLGIEVKKADLKATGDGEMEVDLKTGRVKSGKVVLLVKGTMDITLMNQDAKLTTDQVITITTRFLDRNPLAK